MKELPKFNFSTLSLYIQTGIVFKEIGFVDEKNAHLL
jgi:hypothetical protein